MNLRALAVVLGLVVAALAPLRSAAAESIGGGARVIVKYKAESGLMRALQAGAQAQGPQLAATLAYRHGLALRDGRVIAPHMQVVRGDGRPTSAELAVRLAADPDVEYAVPDGRKHVLALPDDPLFPANPANPLPVGQWYLQAPDATLVSAINAPGAWAITIGSASIVVADIDTGVRFDHPDLAAKLHPGYDFISDPTNSGDGKGRGPDASDPGDWTTTVCPDGSPARNSSWHGTKVAGLIGAQNDNAIGMASIGWRVMVQPVRALGKCGGSDSDIIAAMLWAGGLSASPVPNPNPARVINLSLGGDGACTAYADAISQLNAAGVVVVAAAGNSEGLAVSTPANCAGAIAVTAVRHLGTKVGFASVGPEVAIAAPGGNCVNPSGPCLYPLLTTTNAGLTTPGANTYTDGSNIAVGTSFSTPLVAGTVALMLSVDPTLTPARVRALLQQSARAFPSSGSDPSVTACHAPNGATQDECYCTHATCGAGLLDAGAALAATAAPRAAIAASATSVTAGAGVTLDGSGSSALAGRTIAAYQWAITAGSGIAAFSGATNAASAAVATSGAGSITVQLTVTDSAGAQASQTLAITVAAPASGGGGGAMSSIWLALLALATAVLLAPRRRGTADRATRG